MVLLVDKKVESCDGINTKRTLTGLATITWFEESYFLEELGCLMLRKRNCLIIYVYTLKDHRMGILAFLYFLQRTGLVRNAG